MELSGRTYSSVTGMTQSLGWGTLEKRRNVHSVIIMYKVAND